MKALKILAAAAVALVLAGSVYAYTFTNQGQVITVTLMTEIPAGTAVRTEAPPQATKIDTNANTTTTAYLPDDIGQMLVGHITTTSTNAVWVAVGMTTNDWLIVGQTP